MKRLGIRKHNDNQRVCLFRKFRLRVCRGLTIHVKQIKIEWIVQWEGMLCSKIRLTRCLIECSSLRATWAER